MQDFETSRRTFLAGALGVGLTACAPSGVTSSPSAPPYDGRLGVQLYTVRYLFEKDYAGTLASLAKIGFKDCETAGYFAHDPRDVRSAMDDLGLVSRSGHIRLNELQDGFAKQLETAAIMGQRSLYLGWIPEEERTPDKYRALADLLNTRGEAAKAASIQLGYHNHDFEFADLGGVKGYDILLERTDPSLVAMEIDFYWAAQAGVDPRDLFARAPGRFHSCHIKDRKADGSMVSVGEGQIDFASILSEARKAGLETFYVEHDEPADPIVSVAASYAYLTR
ncbi:sugar phosphate isomerase/epimerase [Qipengyuania sp. 6B39]|uniref:sugar phosphate isomerase/epimerase family protein n=1 Tax=Qipengyuania proteolytica TaxID=2867239 RepID=UPI001C8AE2C1|nr:sugar phosphate isomerase/epimerase [Qipengyuania proteolytica]MBX7495774.1 sugar phosphate isomerase/epimerase [Qipengyuania proteolytica]